MSLIKSLSKARFAPSGPRAGIGVVQRRSAPGQARHVLLILALPSVIALVLVNAYPLFYAAVQAVHDGNLLQAGAFVGLDNFTATFASPAFWRATRFTVVFTLAGVFGSWVVGFGLALLTQAQMPGRTFFRVLLLLPWVVPVVVSSNAWNWLVVTPQSLIPRALAAVGLPDVLLLADPTLAQITVCVFKIWCSFPFMMLMASSALSAVDPEIYEAAAVDGATRFRELLLITLPLIARPTYISWVLMTMFCVNDFPTIYLLTAGGPVDATTSLVVLAYRTVFQSFKTGPGVAIAFVMTLLLIITSVVLFRRIQRSWSE